MSLDFGTLNKWNVLKSDSWHGKGFKIVEIDDIIEAIYYYCHQISVFLKFEDQILSTWYTKDFANVWMFDIFFPLNFTVIIKIIVIYFWIFFTPY